MSPSPCRAAPSQARPALPNDDVRQPPEPGTWRRADGAVARRVTDGVLLLTAADADPFEVVGPAAELWWLLDEPVTAAAVADALAAQFGADPEEVARDVDGLLVALAERGAVEVLGDGATGRARPGEVAQR